MPNWCSNVLVLKHDDLAQIKRVSAGLKGEGLFNEFVPIPQEIKNIDGAWYHWCLHNWGTKWDVQESDGTYISDEGDTHVTVYFDTAWSPPCEFYEQLMTQGFDVVGYYFEPGEGFVGEWNNGENTCYNTFAAGAISDNLPIHLTEMFNIDDWYEWSEEEPLLDFNDE